VITTDLGKRMTTTGLDQRMTTSGLGQRMTTTGLGQGMTTTGLDPTVHPDAAEKRQILSLLGIEPRFLGRIGRSLVAVLTEISRLYQDISPHIMEDGM
jgi:hypothetical protein